MTLLRRRLVKLEERMPPPVMRDTVRQAQLLALQTLPGEELEVLRQMLLRNESAIPESDAERAAMDHYRAALRVVLAENQTPLALNRRRN
jgi:hypothetical protein